MKAALDLEVGEVADPLDLADGFHVVKRIDLGGDHQGEHLRQWHLAHIQCASEDEAKMVLALAREGKIPWTTLVRQYSRDPESRERDGRLLRYRERKYGREFDKIVEALKPGDVAPTVLKGAKGWHVVRRMEPQ